MSPSFTTYETGTCIDWDGDIKVCVVFLLYCLPINTLFLVGYSAILGVIKSLILNTILINIFFPLEDDWSGVVANKIHSVKPVLGDWQSSYRRCRKDEIVFCRARIFDVHLTHSYNLKKDPPLQCEHCQCILTVCHILVECNHFTQ